MSYETVISEEIQNKWAPVLEHPDLPKIKDVTRRSVTAQMLENTEIAMREQSAQMNGTGFGLLSEDGPTNQMGAGNIGTYDPILITLIRRTMPNLVAYDVCGVQPMTGPTGLIFALRPHYNDQSNTTINAFYDEPFTPFSTYDSNIAGTGAQSLGSANSLSSANGMPFTGGTSAQPTNPNTYNYATGANTAIGETFGWSNATTFGQANVANNIPQMGFSVDKVTVTAVTRALKAEYSLELAQDLKAIHGLDAETELANILTGEVLAEINREVIRTLNLAAKQGATDATTAGIFDLDVDSNGRWAVEKFKGLMFQLERECNAVAKTTRRGKGNVLICSSDVASAMQMAGVLQFTPKLDQNNLQVDDTGNTFAGILNGRIKVYIDPYATANYYNVGYKGASAFDAGIFYCPYVPLQMIRAIDPLSFQPKIAFKTRYGMGANPFSSGGANAASPNSITGGANVFYRGALVKNII